MSTAARIDELRKKFEENPRRYFAPLANELRKAGNLSEAIGLCREFLPKQPEHMSGYIVFGQALYESGDLSEARIVFEQALALDPENLKALRHLGDIAKWEGDTAGARRWYERVLEADPRNDDIAAQLATLATPVYVVPVEPTPEPAAPTPSALFAPPDSPVSALSVSVPSATPAFTPAFSMAPIGLGAIPTPDAALRAVDFDEINARLREPDAQPAEIAEAPVPFAEAPAGREADLLDLDAIEAAGQDAEPALGARPDVVDVAAVEEVAPVAAVEPVEVAALDSPVESLDASEDDPFGFSEVEADEGPFEEGLIAPEWPDTAELVARMVTPRGVTPLFVATMTPDAVAAFGVEPGDPMPTPAIDENALFADIEAQLGQPEELSTEVMAELDLDSESAVEFEADDDVVAIVAEPEVEPEAEPEVEPEVEPEAEPGAEPEAEREVEPEAEPRWITSVAPTPDVESELPWLAAATERDSIVFEADVAESMDADAPVDAAINAEATEAAAAPDQAAAAAQFEADIAIDVGAIAMPEVTVLFSDDTLHESDLDPESEPVESSFADVMPEEHNPAFVTETMGELLVSQGFTARAVSVYEELVRRRPYDPVLTSRLAELRERVAAEAAPVVSAFRTPAVATPAFPTPAYPTPAYATPAMGTPAFVASVTPPFVTPMALTPISSPVVESSAIVDEPFERVTARDRFARLASRRVPRRTPPRASVAIDTPIDGLSSLFGGDTAGHDDLAARTLADAFAPIGESSHLGGDLPFEDAMLGGPARSPTPMRSATPIATAAVPDAGGPFSFDRFFPDPATSGAPQHTPVHSPSTTPVSEPSREIAPPTVSDDLAQFSAWLKGLGNT